MTAKQVDKLIGHKIEVSFPAYGSDTYVVTPVRRDKRKSIVRCAGGQVYEAHQMHLVKDLGLDQNYPQNY